MSQFMSFLRKHYVAVSILTLATVATLWFAGSLLLNFIYFNDPRNQDKDLKPWMSPHYVGMSYDIPRPVVAEVLGLDGEIKGKSLGRIAAAQGLTMEELTARVREGVAAYRADKK